MVVPCSWSGDGTATAGTAVGENTNPDILEIGTLSQTSTRAQQWGNITAQCEFFFVPKLAEKHAMRGVRPDKHLHILYYARSLCPKLDELHALCDIEKPEVVCITETWLCDDIGESEVSIPGYKCIS